MLESDRFPKPAAFLAFLQAVSKKRQRIGRVSCLSGQNHTIPFQIGFDY